MKQINKKHRWLACLLAFIMFIGVVEPFGVVKAEGAVNTGALALKTAYATGTNQYTALLFEFQSQTTISLPETGKLTAVEGSGDVLRNGTSVLGKVNFTATSATGGFKIDGIEGTGSWPEKTETFAIKGQFTLPSGTIVEFPTTTFQYMGTNTSGFGYWRDYTATVESGAIALDSTSLDGTDSLAWGRVLFTVSNEYYPAPASLRQLVSDGGTIKEKTSSEVEFVDITSNVKLLAGSSDSSLKCKYIIEPGSSYTSGTIYTIEGKFKTEDGFSVNFPKTAIKRENVNGTHKWSYYNDVRDSGEVTINSGFEGGVLKFWPENATDVTFSSSVQLMAVSGKGTILQNGNDVSSSVELWSYTSGLHAIWGTSANVGTEITLEGDFALSNDSTVVVRYPKIVFEIVSTSDGGKRWVQVRADNYAESGAVTVHDNSASGSTPQADRIYFKTDDTSLVKNVAGDSWLRPEQGTILYNGSDITSSVLHAGNARIYSYSNGVYLMYLQRNAVNGTTVTLQGTFAMADGSAGVDFQPVTFMYVLPEQAENGYWVTVGTSFTSDIYWEAENAYDEEIQAFEATVRLPKNAKGGVILGTNRDSNDTYTFGVDVAGAPYLALRDGDTTVEYKFADINACTGNWVTMRIVRDGTTVKYYESDTLKGTLTNQTAVSVKPTAKATVGGNYTTNNANYFKGSIKDVTVYADAECTQKIASYDMSVVPSSTKTLADGNDSKEYDITRTLRWLDANEVSEPSNYAYSFAVVGDTQAINDKNGNKNDKLQNIYDYIVNNKDNQKIKFVFGLGDITENNDTSEWARAQAQIQKLDAAGIPYSLNRGNHEGALQGTDSSLMNQYFPYENYKNKLNVYSDGNIENSCQKLTVGNVDYLIFALDYNPSQDVLDWAGSIIESHPNYNVIITTHGYMTAKEVYTSDAEGGGARVWDNLAKKYSNIVLVLCGHVFANDIAWNQVNGENENKVTQMVINPQTADAMTDGGTGMVAMLYFSEDGKDVQVRYYSTVREQYLADTNQFNMQLNVVEHVDAVTVEPYEYAKFITYRTEGNYTAPTKEGYLFAGWFTDPECKNPLMQGAAVDSTKTYYAKFVDKYAQVVKRQIRVSEKDNTKRDLRLVTTLDSLDYAEVGFRVTFGDNPTKTKSFQKAYKTLYGAGILYRPDIFSAASVYFATLTITNIPKSVVDQNITVGVQTYWTTYDGTTVESVTDVKNLLPVN